MASAQIRRWGNSLAVRLPKPLAEQAGLSEGDRVNLTAARGQIQLRRADQVPTLEKLVEQITPENRYVEISTGPARGKETVEW